MKRISLFLTLLFAATLFSFAKEPQFRALVLAENGGHHVEFSKAAEKWLKDYASANDFKYDVINNTDKITDYFLSRYALFIQLDYPPFVWTGNAKQASVISLKAAEAG